MGKDATGRCGHWRRRLLHQSLAVLSLAAAVIAPAIAQEPPLPVTPLPPSMLPPAQGDSTSPSAAPAPLMPIIEIPSMGTAGAASSAAPPEPTNRFPLTAFWNNGLHFAAFDDQFRIHVGGNGQWDSVWLIGPKGVLAAGSQNVNSTQNDGASLLRRARIRLDGDIWQRFDYMLEYDFANAVNENRGVQNPTLDNVTSAPMPTNVWMQVRDVPLFGNVRIGQQLKPIGMTNNTYQGFLPFMERADNMDAFYGSFDEGFATGIAAMNWTESERVTWRYGIFRPLKDSFGIAISRFLTGSRVTALPVYEDDGQRLVHVGFGSTYGDFYQDQFRVRARAALRNGPGYALPVLVDTGEVPGSRQGLIGPEFAAVVGPWTLQAEWTGMFVTDAIVAGLSQGTLFYHGGYVQLLYFLTGEHQAYEKREGVFSRVVPRRNLSSCGGGAWQVGARFSYLDATSKTVDGGQVQDCTVGLNWFLNPNMKLQFNYVLTHRDAPQDVGTGWFNGLGVRAAFDF